MVNRLQTMANQNPSLAKVPIRGRGFYVPNTLETGFVQIALSHYIFVSLNVGAKQLKNRG